MKRVAAALVLLALWAVQANANPPWPYEEFCEVFPQDNMDHPRLVGVPFGGTYPFPAAWIEVHIYDYQWHPLPGVEIQVLFDPVCASDRLCWCPNGTYEGITNAQGVAYLYVALGGCCERPQAAMICMDTPWGPYPLRIYDTVASPGYAGAPSPGNCDVSLPDFVYFGDAYLAAAGGCSDYDGDGSTTLSDFVTFGSTWGVSCETGSVRATVAGGGIR
jgi:hypothetical protein